MSLATWLLMLITALGIGYLAQVTGSCLVRGVADWLRGQRIRLLALLTNDLFKYFESGFVSTMCFCLPIVPCNPFFNKLVTHFRK